MKFKTITRCATAAAMSLAIGLGTVACSRDYTAAYVYAVSNSTGQVSAFAVDYQTGILTQISGSPFTTVFSNPSTVIAAPNNKTIYVISGTQTLAAVEAMSVGSDGKVYGIGTTNMPADGTYPTAAAIDSTGTFLYVTYTYQDGYTPVSPGPGGVGIFPINADGSLGTPSNVNVGNNPIAIAVSAPTCTTTPVISTNAACAAGGTPNVFVYVVDAETALAKPTILGFGQNTSTGALTMLSGTTYDPSLGTYQGTTAGVAPSSIAIDPTSKYLYVTDKLQNEIYGYQIASLNTGNLLPLVSSPFSTGSYPVAITIEPRGKYVYVANYNSGTVNSYSLNLSNGSLGGSATTGSGFSTATGPTCVTVEPALGIYLYTSNYLAGSISGGQVNPDTGQLSATVNTPYPTASQPVCLTSVANGPHASQLVQQ
jgi:6-phosphogluconolactonase (cycloisomerase 2 family)